MVWWSASLWYETSEKKLDEVDFISQGVELISRVVKEIEDSPLDEIEVKHFEMESFGGGFEEDINGEDEEDKEDEDGDGKSR
ncbi:hypothetical protein Tco_0656910 [Tanacetum coccineum]|uniref:Uncharacterized protein n=1 Tax=Tanacetum coccineum TaxID=301880 RepID=A0ABQ4XA54_9ASTR